MIGANRSECVKKKDKEKRYYRYSIVTRIQELLITLAHAHT